MDSERLHKVRQRILASEKTVPQTAKEEIARRNDYLTEYRMRSWLSDRGIITTGPCIIETDVGPVVYDASRNCGTDKKLFFDRLKQEQATYNAA